MAQLGDGSWNGIAMKPFSDNRRRILSLWLPRLPIDRIKRQLICESDALDRARGAFAAALGRKRLGRAAVRRRARAQSSWPGRAMDHGMEM